MSAPTGENDVPSHRSHHDSTLTLESGSVDNFQSADDLDYSFTGKLKRTLKTIYKYTSSLIGLIFLLIAYSFLGAFLFTTIEGSHEHVYKRNITASRDSMIAQLLLAAANLTTTIQTGSGGTDAWKLATKAMLVDYEATIMDAYKNDVTSSSDQETWGFWSSLFFAGTVYTTIGYGNIAPVTDWGRMVSMIYAALGIPLALLVLAELGKRFTVALKFFWAFVRRYYYTGNFRKIRKPFMKKMYQFASKDGQPETSEDGSHSKAADDKSEDESKTGSKTVYGYEIDDEFNVPITVAIAILFIYIILGGCMYSIWEEWSFLEAFYFVFISISTIGFGDVTPAHTKFFILSSVYIFIGLSLVSMCVNVAIEFFSDTIDKTKQRMGKAKKKIGKKVTQAGKNAKDKYANIKKDIIEETNKIRDFADEITRRASSSTSLNTIHLPGSTLASLNPNRGVQVLGDINGNPAKGISQNGRPNHPNNESQTQVTDHTYEEIQNVNREDKL